MIHIFFLLSAKISVELSKMTSMDRFKITKQLMNTQIHMEDSMYEIAKIHYNRTQQPVVLMCDRGLNDNEAYFRDPILWVMMRHDNKWFEFFPFPDFFEEILKKNKNQ